MKEYKNIEEKVPLSGLSTFKVGGHASYLLRVTSCDEIKEAVLFAKEKSLPVMFLGGGSNILFGDSGFNGLILKIDIKGIRAEEQKGGREEVLVTVGAGEGWDAFVAWTLAHGYFGLENLSAIPGTVGAAPIQNIGAYGVEAKDSIESVEVFDTESLEFKVLSNKECKFGYRSSIFKTPEGKSLVVTGATFRLSKLAEPKIGYKDLALYFKDKGIPTALEVRDAVTHIRGRKFPDLDTYGTAGSFWKNIICEASVAESLKAKYPDLPVYDAADGKKKLSTAFILDKVCGLREYRVGNVGLFAAQTLVVTNYGGATAEEIKNFIAKVKLIVKEKTGIVLEEEVVVL